MRPYIASGFRRALSISSRNRGYVFQEDALFPWITVYQNVALGLLDKRELSHAERNDIVNRYLAIADFGQAFPHELSGGTKQRAAIARTCAGPKRFANGRAVCSPWRAG